MSTTDRATSPSTGTRRLLFIGDDLERLKAERFTVRRAQLVRLLEECERGSATRFTPEPPNESTTWAGIGSMNRALLALLTDDEQDLTEAERWIEGAISWEDWGNAHLVNVDLSAAWILWGLSLAYDWLKDDMDPALRVRLREKLTRHGRIMHDYIRDNRGESWVPKYWQNHNWIDYNGLASAGYALVDELPEAQAWIDDARANFELVFRGMPEDGSNYEGAVYWRYGVPWLLCYAHLLREREGVDYFATSGFLRNTFWYRLYQSTPNLEEAFNFGDAHDTRSSTSAMMYMKLASEYRLGEAQYMAEHALAHLYREQYQSALKPGILPEAGLEYLWFDATVEPSTDLSHLPLSRFFPDLGLLAVRDSWAKDAVMLSVKCGFPGGRRQWEQSWDYHKETGIEYRSLSHQHADNGAILLNAFGSYLLCDDGYNRTIHAREHSVVTVGGRGYRNEGQNDIFAGLAEDEVAVLNEYVSDGGFFVFDGDTARCYVEDLGITDCRRIIGSNGNRYVIVFDRLAATQAHRYEWNMQAASTPAIDGTTVRYLHGLAGLDLWSLEPAAPRISSTLTTVRAIYTTQEPDAFHEAVLNTLVIENAEPAEQVTYLTALAPFRREAGASD
uniref:DUF4962 domain-containing protein n=1 Tax=Actinotalea sp. TaxID=1872145 RepID=UPI003568A970